MIPLKIAFADMWGYDDPTPTGIYSYFFNPYDNYFTDLFSQKFNVQITNNNPDLLIYSVFGNSYKRFKCKKLLFSGENLRAGKGEISHYNDSTVTLSHYEDEQKEVFMPLWVLHTNWFNKPQPRPLPCNPTYSITLNKISTNRERFLKDRKFCCFINNNVIEDRIKLFEALHKREHIDSYGNLMNNVGCSLRGSQYDKVKLLEKYKFNIAFENSYHKGYNTEKIIEPFESGCIPLYNGGEQVRTYFNKESFLYLKDYSNYDDYINEIIKINNNKDLYEHKLLQNPLNEENINRDFSPSVVLEKILTKLNL
ncbi:MAG: hypothetical protein EBU90_03365 [Proteobacteria bacterium]|nr:hypothetical protein [Pseudomonadota bacterium]NBP13366.1 hypothetical protein [bacterium]